jgi:hypothetical protein
MKKLIYLTALTITLLSCKKYEPEKDCTCGVIANDGVDYNNGNSCYWLEIRNSCSNNKKKFCFDQDVWISAYVGSNFCVSGVQPW